MSANSKIEWADHIALNNFAVAPPPFSLPQGIGNGFACGGSGIVFMLHSIFDQTEVCTIGCRWKRADMSCRIPNNRNTNSRRIRQQAWINASSSINGMLQFGRLPVEFRSIFYIAQMQHKLQRGNHFEGENVQQLTVIRFSLPLRASGQIWRNTDGNYAADSLRPSRVIDGAALIPKPANLHGISLVKIIDYRLVPNQEFELFRIALYRAGRHLLKGFLILLDVPRAIHRVITKKVLDRLIRDGKEVLAASGEYLEFRVPATANNVSHFNIHRGLQ